MATTNSPPLVAKILPLGKSLPVQAIVGSQAPAKVLTAAKGQTLAKRLPPKKRKIPTKSPTPAKIQRNFPVDAEQSSTTANIPTPYNDLALETSPIAAEGLLLLAKKSTLANGPPPAEIPLPAQIPASTDGLVPEKSPTAGKLQCNVPPNDERQHLMEAAARGDMSIPKLAEKEGLNKSVLHQAQKWTEAADPSQSINFISRVRTNLPPAETTSPAEAKRQRLMEAVTHGDIPIANLAAKEGVTKSLLYRHKHKVLKATHYSNLISMSSTNPAPKEIPKPAETPAETPAPVTSPVLPTIQHDVSTDAEGQRLVRLMMYGDTPVAQLVAKEGVAESLLHRYDCMKEWLESSRPSHDSSKSRAMALHHDFLLRIIEQRCRTNLSVTTPEIVKLYAKELDEPVPLPKDRYNLLAAHVEWLFRRETNCEWKKKQGALAE